MKDIVIVVPTIRPKLMAEKFLPAWDNLFKKYRCTWVIVEDGKNPTVSANNQQFSVKDIMGKDADLIYNFNDGVRNLGFAYVAKYLYDIDFVVTLDDDVVPVGDTIRDHLEVLSQRVPVSWISTASEYMRGFPYGIRNEAEVVLSHGVWEGIKDYDAPTQLVKGNPDVDFYKGVIPKGIYYPMCGMNLAFKRKMLPYMYWAPMGYRVGLGRFADIWLGIISKRIIDKKGWAVVSGYARVKHEQASDVFKNLQKEARGLKLNEGFWRGEESNSYFRAYGRKRKRWEKFINDQN